VTSEKACAPHAESADQQTQTATPIEIAGAAFVGDPAGALYWPAQGLLAVADLHLEKGSSFAARGVLLPPYDTAATLARLAALIARYTPRVVVALGDSFHDGRGPARLADVMRHAQPGWLSDRSWELWRGRLSLATGQAIPEEPPRRSFFDSI